MRKKSKLNEYGIERLMKEGVFIANLGGMIFFPYALGMYTLEEF